MSFFKKISRYKILFYTLVVVLVLFAIKGFQIYQAIQASAGNGPPPATINTAIVQEGNWPYSVKAVGTVKAKQGAMLSFEAAGRVESVNFKPGDQVKVGQELIILDSKVEQAQLEAAQAELKLAEITAKRQQKLREQNANSQADLDTAIANLSLAKAEVLRIESVMQRRMIRAPFSGIAGVKQVNVGEYVNIGQRGVDVNSKEEFYVDFYLPHQEVQNFTIGDTVELKIKNHSVDSLKASLSGINSQVDPVNRNILLQASIKNEKDLLKPGMFIDLQLQSSVKQNALFVPITAVLFTTYGNTVYEVVKEKAEPPYAIQPHTVKVGRTKGDFIEVLSGLQKGQELVGSGLNKIFPGVQVFIDNKIKANPELEPKVENK